MLIDICELSLERLPETKGEEILEECLKTLREIIKEEKIFDNCFENWTNPVTSLVGWVGLGGGFASKWGGG